MTNKLLKISRILLVSVLLALGTNTDNVWAYWNTVKCEQESIDEKELQEDGFSAEEITKMQQLKKAEYEFCLAKKAVADKDAEDRDLNSIEYSEVGYLEPDHFTSDGLGRNNIELTSAIEKPITHFDQSKRASNVVEALKRRYPNMMQNLINKAQAVNNLMDGIPCGPDYPFGCPPGTACYSKTTGHSIDSETNIGSIQETDFGCKNPHDLNLGWSEEKEKGSSGSGDSFTVNIAGKYTTVVTDSGGFSYVGTNMISESEDKTSSYRGDNSACDVAGMQSKYQSRCYSCKIILTLITTFMNACGRVYDLTREAGGKVLVIGSLIWFAAFSLKLVSSFTNQEPMSILNDFFIFMFKAASAYIFLNAGIGIIINLLVNPLLIAGADYGIGLMKAANEGIVNIATTTNYAYSGTEIISAKVINKLMALTQGIDKTVANNLVIGHALTCHAFNAGMITHVLDLKLITVTLRIPDIWIWLCGAAIWFCGFMLTLGVGYYLLDVCFKIGFCIIALPIVIGLWPFSMTEGKFKSCMSIIIRSAALFAFLALTVSYALSLISVSLGDLTVFFEKIKAGDHEWISDTFSISGSKFIIIMFAYVYSIKMVGETVTGYLDRFFSDSVFGGASPMHNKATQITDFAKQKVTQAAGFAGGVVTHQASRATAAVLGGTVNMVKRAVRGKKSGGGASSENTSNNKKS